MKAVLTLIFVLLFGLTAFAQNTKDNVTMEPVKMDNVLDSGNVVIDSAKGNKINSEKSVARLYKFKNSKVKKTLAFYTKKDRPKLS